MGRTLPGGCSVLPGTSVEDAGRGGPGRPVRDCGWGRDRPFRLQLPPRTTSTCRRTLSALSGYSVSAKGVPRAGRVHSDIGPSPVGGCPESVGPRPPGPGRLRNFDGNTDWAPPTPPHPCPSPSASLPVPLPLPLPLPKRSCYINPLRSMCSHWSEKGKSFNGGLQGPGPLFGPSCGAAQHRLSFGRGEVSPKSGLGCD